MKFISISCIALFLSCQGKQQPASAVSFNHKQLSRYISSGQGIIVSCNRCSCVDDFLNYYFAHHGKIAVFGDKFCNRRFSNQMVNLPQAVIDSVYERNYNLVLFKNLHTGVFAYRILKTEDNSRFSEIMGAFFTPQPPQPGH